MTDAHLITNPHGRTVAVTSEWVRENQRVLSSGPWRFVTRAVPGSAGVPPASSQSSLPGAPANTSPRVSTARHHPGTAGVLTCFEKSVRPADIVRARTRPVIVHILPWTLATGGAQRFILMLADAFATHAEIHLIYPGDGAQSPWIDALAPIRLHPVATTSQARRVLAELDPDLVHHHHPSGGWLMDRIHAPLVGTQHAFAENANPHACVVRICGDRAGVVPHGVDLEIFAPPKRRKRREVFVAGIVGRRSPEKLPASFLRAVANVTDANILFRFIGRGLASPALRETERVLAAAPRVEVMGDVPPASMPGVLRDLDALVVPSMKDSVSFAAIEAMACGVPVIARRVEGLPATVGGAGTLCDTDAGLIDAVRAMAALSPAAMRRRRRAARARAIERFDARRMLGRYSDIYAERTNGAVRLPDTNLDVSVVIPVRDTPGAWLAESIESVLAQGDCEGLNPQSSILDPRFEIVLVDDGSTRPDTLAVIDAAARDPRVRVIRQTHAGVGAALNAGVRTARAEIIARHDADDVMLPGRLAAQLARLRADPDLALVAGQMIVTDADGRDIRELALIFDPATPLTHQPFAIAHPAVCVRRAAVLSAGGYGDGAGQDLDLWCRMQLAGLRMLVTADLVTRYRTHPAQVTARSDAARLREIVRGRYESRFAADPRFSNAMNAAPRASARG